MIELKAIRNAIRLGSTTVLEVFNGSPPFNIEVLAGGAGGVITTKGDATYYYTAPFLVSDDKRVQSDTVKVTDADGGVSEIKIYVLSMEKVIADIIHKRLNVPMKQIVIGNQSFIPPTDGKAYFCVIIGDGKPYSVTSNQFDEDEKLYEENNASFRDLLTVNMVSSSNAVLAYRHRLILALGSDYATKSQESFSYKLGRIPINMSNVSGVVGSKIPYAFNITIPIMYSIREVNEISYFNNFEENDIILDK